VKGRKEEQRKAGRQGKQGKKTRYLSVLSAWLHNKIKFNAVFLTGKSKVIPVLK
jgi:hypothetical protein